MPLRSRLTAFRYRVEYALFRLVGGLFGALPVETASALSGALWRTIAPRTSRHSRALRHLRDAFPEKTEAELERIARGMWDNLGRTFAEAFHLKTIAASDRVTYDNHEVLLQWASAPGGKIACGGHIGNWELEILGPSQLGVQPWSIYRPLKNPLVDAAVHRMRAFLYTGGLVPISPAVPRQFLKVVRDGGTVGLLSDQRDNSGIVVELFGKPAPSTSFPAVLARSIGAPILMGRTRRLPGVRFVHSCEILTVPETDDRRADIEAATVAIQKTFERYVRDTPEQWMWAHRRWS